MAHLRRVSTTSQRRQMAFASSIWTIADPALPIGKNSSGSSPRRVARFRPRSSAFGEDAYRTLGLKAVALLHSLARNHRQVDGNKRLAWLATVVFLDLNSYDTSLTKDAAFALVIDVSVGDVDVEEIAQRLRLTG